MDPRLLRYYNQELTHVREMGAEFAQQFPKIAARLGIDGIEVSDPYVERLLESFAFLAGRVQLKLDAEFPRFTQRMLEIIYPQYLAPTPSMLIAQLKPDVSDSNLVRGFTIPRGSTMRSLLGKGDLTACEFRTAHDVRLLPLDVAAVSYFAYAPDLPLTQLPTANRIKGGLRIRLRLGSELTFRQVDLPSLPIYLSGSDDIAFKLHELALGSCLGMLVVPAQRPQPWYEFIPPGQIEPIGFDDAEALLPVTLRGFQGYRLIHEYFAFPQRYMFLDLKGLTPALRRCDGNEIEIVLLFGRNEPTLESMVDASNISLFCTPAINLFSKRADRIHLTDSVYEYHVVPDRTRPMDFEVYDIESVTGYGTGVDAERKFLPFYVDFHTEDVEHNAYYTFQREPRLLSAKQKRVGHRSSYIGSEVFLSLVDPQEAPFGAALKQLSVVTTCTNRDLPLQIPTGVGTTDLNLDTTAPVISVRVVKGPSRPYSSLREGNVAWQFINHLSLNYLSLRDAGAEDGAAALREMLRLYALSEDPALTRQIDGLRAVSVRPTVRRFPLPGPVTFARGLQVELETDDLSFQGASQFLFGAVMERFIARYASLNSFTETVLRSNSRGELMRWKPRCGTRPIV